MTSSTNIVQNLTNGGMKNLIQDKEATYPSITLG